MVKLPMMKNLSACLILHLCFSFIYIKFQVYSKQESINMKTQELVESRTGTEKTLSSKLFGQ